MLDRHEQPNIFDPQQRASGDAETDGGSVTSTEPPSASGPTQRIPRSPVAGMHVLRAGAGWGSHAGRLRRGVRFLPLGIMLVFLLARSEGCGGTRTIEAATSPTAIAPSSAVTPTAVAHPGTEVSDVRARMRPAPTRTRHGRRSTRTGRNRVRHRAPRPRVSVGVHSAKDPQETDVAEAVVSTRAVSASSPAFTSASPSPSSPSGHLRRETGAEFGFEH
jgi:hypothetical protein